MKALLAALLLSLAVAAQGGASVPATAPAASASMQQPIAGPRGQIESTADVADPIFQVHAKVIGLERSIEMLQWRKSGTPSSPYEMAWSAERIDSSGFDAAHRNPADFPFNGERWWTVDARLDGHPVSAEVLGTADAWTPFKPHLSQLPTNLAVSFQPDGEWLSTSQDPGHPQVGDVRVRWHAISAVVAPVGVQLVNGQWQMAAKSTVVASTSASASTQPLPTTDASADIKAWVQGMFGAWAGWLIVAGAVLAIGLLVLRRRR